MAATFLLARALFTQRRPRLPIVRVRRIPLWVAELELLEDVLLKHSRLGGRNKPLLGSSNIQLGSIIETISVSPRRVHPFIQVRTWQLPGGLRRPERAPTPACCLIQADLFVCLFETVKQRLHANASDAVAICQAQIVMSKSSRLAKEYTGQDHLFASMSARHHLSCAWDVTDRRIFLLCLNLAGFYLPTRWRYENLALYTYFSRCLWWAPLMLGCPRKFGTLNG